MRPLASSTTTDGHLTLSVVTLVYDHRAHIRVFVRICQVRRPGTREPVSESPRTANTILPSGTPSESWQAGLSGVFPLQRVSLPYPVSFHAARYPGCHDLGAASIKMAQVYSEHHSEGAVGLMGKPLRWRLPSQSSDLLSRTVQTEGRLVFGRVKPKDDWYEQSRPKGRSVGEARIYYPVLDSRAVT